MKTWSVPNVLSLYIIPHYVNTVKNKCSISFLLRGEGFTIYERSEYIVKQVRGIIFSLYTRQMVEVL